MSSTRIEIEEDETEDGTQCFEVTTDTWRGRNRTRKVRDVPPLDNLIAIVTKTYGPRAGRKATA